LQQKKQARTGSQTYETQGLFDKQQYSVTQTMHGTKGGWFQENLSNGKYSNQLPHKLTSNNPP